MEISWAEFGVVGIVAFIVVTMTKIFQSVINSQRDTHKDERAEWRSTIVECVKESNTRVELAIRELTKAVKDFDFHRINNEDLIAAIRNSHKPEWHDDGEAE